MMADHTQFEVLCALAASGQLTSSELAELHAHSQNCSSCSERVLEMTQISAQLFCAHAVNQPSVRMPKEMLERFIARANNEGIPLGPRAATAVFTRPALATAFLLALLLVIATLHFGFLAKSGVDAARSKTATVVSPIDDESKSPAGLASHVAPYRAQAPRISNGPKVIDRPRPSRVASTALEPGQFDLTAYSRKLEILHRPFFAAARPSRNNHWSPAPYGTPKFQFAGPSEFAKNDPPRLFAVYERRTFAPWTPQEMLDSGPPDLRVTRLDFDPMAYANLLNLDFKRNLPTFQFTPMAPQ
jgi:hypothetical protein